MLQIKLSICIPTYNRAKYLKENLESIIDQLDENTKDIVEICVSDNASTDNTLEIIESFKKRFANIKYFCWDKNMGADNNYLHVVEMASGKFCLILGSDDIIEPKGIETMLQNIENNKHIYIFCVNYLIYDLNLKNPSLAKHLMWKQKTDIVFNNYTNCIKRMGEMFGYLSTFVFKKEKWDKFAKEKKYIGSAYSHTYIFFSILKDNGALKYIAKPLIGYRKGNDSFLSEGDLKRIKIDIVGYDEIASDVFGRRSKEAKTVNNMVLNIYVFGWIFYTILGGNASFKYRFEVAKLALKHYRRYISFWLKILPLLMTPLCVLKIVRLFYRITIKKFNHDNNESTKAYNL